LGLPPCLFGGFPLAYMAKPDALARHRDDRYAEELKPVLRLGFNHRRIVTVWAHSRDLLIPFRLDFGRTTTDYW